MINKIDLKEIRSCLEMAEYLGLLKEHDLALLSCGGVLLVPFETSFIPTTDFYASKIMRN